MSRKEVIYQGLLDLPVVIEDFSVSSPNYFRVTNLPTEFTSGQNIFKFKGNPDVFVEDTPIEIEILDSNGDPIYFEVDLDLESSEQEAIISVFITQDIPPGAVEIILCGVIDQDANGNRISVTTQPNFRWTTTVATNPSKRNATEIIFNVTPSVTITSSTGSYLDKIYSGGNKFVDVTIDNLDYRYVNNTAVFLTSSATVTPFNSNVVSAKAFISSSAISSATSLSPTIPGTLATAIFSSSLSITSGSGVGYLTDFIALSILNSNSQYIPRQGRISSITVTYEQTASAEPATENKYNLATAFFTNLNPTVGTVARIRSYYRSAGIGEYILSNETDITSTETEFGFTSEVVTASFAIPTVHRNDRLDFKFEFLNPSGIVAKQSIQSLNNLFLGGNTYVGGDDNLLTGSLFVAGETGTGVQLSGRNNAALIRSIGYTGFSNALDGSGQAGFVMYSGSVQSLLTAAESYAGVGLELVANSESYFRYATDNGGELDIRTNKFFIGNQDVFLSGSNGQLEILYKSGSGAGQLTKFRLDTTGQVTASAFITFTGSNDSTNYRMMDTSIGLIDGKNIGRLIYYQPSTITQISQSTATLQSSTGVLYSTMLPSGSVTSPYLAWSDITNPISVYVLPYENAITIFGNAIITKNTAANPNDCRLGFGFRATIWKPISSSLSNTHTTSFGLPDTSSLNSYVAGKSGSLNLGLNNTNLPGSTTNTFDSTEASGSTKFSRPFRIVIPISSGYEDSILSISLQYNLLRMYRVVNTTPGNDFTFSFSIANVNVISGRALQSNTATGLSQASILEPPGTPTPA
jgi:hypothetical protein